MRKAFIGIMAALFIGCESYVEKEVAQADPIYMDSSFIGRIIYSDGSPYTNGTVYTTGTDWNNTTSTDNNGTFIIEVVGDNRFTLSALNGSVLASFDSPLIVPQFEVSQGIICLDGIEIDNCIDDKSNYIN